MLHSARTLISVALLFGLVALATAQPEVVLSETFDDSSSLPTGWRVQQVNAGGWTIRNGTLGSLGAPAIPGRVAIVLDNTVHDGRFDYLETPPLDFSRKRYYQLQFHSFLSGRYGYRGFIQVGQLNSTQFDTILAVSANEALYEQIQIPLGGYAGCRDVVLRFWGSDSLSSGSGWAIDNVTVIGYDPQNAPLCVQISYPAGSFMPIGSSISWSHVVNATGYRITLAPVIGLDRYEDDTDLGFVTVYQQKRFNFSGSYRVLIVPYNHVGRAYDCEQEYYYVYTVETTFPVNIDFDVGLPPFSGGNDMFDGGEDWVTNSSILIDSLRPNVYDHTTNNGTGQFAFVNSAAPHFNPTNYVTGGYLLTNLTFPVLSFWVWDAFYYIPADVSLHVDVWDNENARWCHDIMPPFIFVARLPSGNESSWTQISIDLSPYKSIGKVAFRFRGHESQTGDNTFPIMIDDVSIFDNVVPPENTRNVNHTCSSNINYNITLSFGSIGKKNITCLATELTTSTVTLGVSTGQETSPFSSSSKGGDDSALVTLVAVVVALLVVLIAVGVVVAVLLTRRREARRKSMIAAATGTGTATSISVMPVDDALNSNYRDIPMQAVPPTNYADAKKQNNANASNQSIASVGSNNSNNNGSNGHYLNMSRSSSGSNGPSLYNTMPSRETSPQASNGSVDDVYNNYRTSSQPPSPIKIKESYNRQNNNASSSLAKKENSWEISYSELVMEKEIGNGSFGVVYRAKWRQAPVAVKQLTKDAKENIENQDPQMTEFMKEATLLMKLRPHTNVVQFQGVCMKPLCLIYEYLSNGSLYQLLQSNAVIDVALQLKLLRGIAAGMLHLHTEGIIHRDLAARNILLTSDFTPKVADFGMSRFAEDPGSGSRTKSSTGPLKWMSPESLLHRKYSIKTDVWAFGVLMYELFAREDPYPDLDPVQAATHVVSGNATLEFPVGSVLPEFITLARQCLSHDSDIRPDFHQIGEALLAVQIST